MATPSPPAPPTRQPKTSLLVPGQGIERRLGRTLRKAEKPYQASIDLHGMSQKEAHRALQRFLEQAVARNYRCLLVITGKGRAEGEGILRREVPRWLNEPKFRPFILAFDKAAPKHGGDGALYVLLRKKKK